MGIPWLSFLTQKYYTAVNIYDLVLLHRKVILVIAFVLDFFIIVRFRWQGLLFVILFELTKFYFFGDRFLGESIAVYGAVYLLGLLLVKLYEKKLYVVDYISAGFFAWLIIIMREPYIPLALFSYLSIMWGKIHKQQIYSLIVFLLLLGIVALHTHISAFVFNDIMINSTTQFSSQADEIELFGIGVFPIFLYPLFIFSYGVFNHIRLYEILLSVVFLTAAGIEIYKRRRSWISIALIFFLLGLANLRLAPPGTVYFESFHQLIWYGMFLFSIIFLCSSVFKKLKIVGAVLLGTLLLGWSMVVFGPSSYIYDKIDLQEQLLTNFGTIMNVGTVIKDLSQPSDTVFTDKGEDMIIWQSGLSTPYPYVWYTSVMPSIPLYRDARTTMFRENPPTFYYDFCTKEAPYNSSLPQSVKSKYQQLYENGKPSCLYVLKTKIPEVTQEKWERANKGFFSLPPKSL